jgi:predicted metal-binding protein
LNSKSKKSFGFEQSFNKIRTNIHWDSGHRKEELIGLIMTSTKKIESYLKKQGLSDYKWIKPKEIVVAQWVRVKCTFGCSDYGLGTCPPNTPSVKDCERFFKEYEKGLVIRFKKTADKNSYPSDWSKEMTKKLLDAEREIFLSGYHKVFLLNQTCCSLCKDCSGNRIGCKDKTNSRPSPESFAVDVYKTVRNAGLELDVVPDSPSEITRIAILLIE